MFILVNSVEYENSNYVDYCFVFLSIRFVVHILEELIFARAHFIVTELCDLCINAPKEKITMKLTTY